jgi:hypothetical protein
MCGQSVRVPVSLGPTKLIHPGFRASPEGSPKSRDKGTGLTVADSIRHLFDGIARNNKLNRFGQTKLASPRVQVNAKIVDKNSLQGSHADAGLGTQASYRLWVVWIVDDA